MPTQQQKLSVSKDQLLFYVITTSTNSSIEHNGEGVVEEVLERGRGGVRVEGKLLQNKREMPVSPS